MSCNGTGMELRATEDGPGSKPVAQIERTHAKAKALEKSQAGNSTEYE